MNKKILTQSLFCIFVLGVFLYSYIDKQNKVTKLRLRLPEVAKEIQALREENTRLQYQIERFESPEHLMMLARRSEFSHLKHPLMKEITTLEEGIAMEVIGEEQKDVQSIKPRVNLVIGAKQ